MKYCVYLILFSSIVFFSCKSTYQNTEKINPVFIVFQIDTLVEKNSPSNIDLTKHQVYIDTSRTNTHYNFLINWKLEDFNDSYLSEYMRDNYNEFQKKSFDFKSFPRKWAVIRKFRGESVLYKRCNGTDVRYGLTDSTILLLWHLEGDGAYIDDVEFKSEKEIKLKIYNKEKEPWIFQISETNELNVYLLTSSVYGDTTHSLIAPSDKAREFDMVVSHCPNMMVNDRIKFDEIDYSIYNNK